MLNPAKKHDSLAGKLLLSSALVGVSLAYALWQSHTDVNPNPAIMPVAPQSNASVPAYRDLATAAPASTAPTGPATGDGGAAPASARPEASLEPSIPAAPKSTVVAIARPADAATSATRPAAPTEQSQQNMLLPASPPPPALSAWVALQMNLPTDAPSPPLPPVTGTPAAGATAPIPSGTHLADGEYFSDKQQYEWGDLIVKISVHGGQITGVQVVRYPDHRSQSLYLSQLASPILASEVIKTQQSKVDTVSSATDTSFAYQDAIASAIVKATR